MCWKLIAIFNLLKIRMRVDIFGIEKCKVTFGLKYIIEQDIECVYMYLQPFDLVECDVGCKP